VSRDVLAVLALAVVGLGVLYPALGAGFVLVDDHGILAFSPVVRANPGLAPPDLVATIFVDGVESGRLRPLFWVIRYAQSIALDGHANWWHALYVALGLSAGGLSYLTVRAAGVGRFVSFLAGTWVIVFPGAGTVWIRLGPQESLASVLFLIATLAIARGARPSASVAWDWIFVLSATAAALIKESFALVPPALFVARLLAFYHWRPDGAWLTRRAWVPGAALVAIGLVLTGLAFTVARRSGSGSYGGAFVNAAALTLDETTITNLEVLLIAGGIITPILGVGMLFDLVRRREMTTGIRCWLIGAAATGVLILPQLVLYRRFGGFLIGRYILPAGLGMTLAIGAGIAWSLRRHQRPVFLAATAVWVSIIVFGSVDTWMNAEWFRADSIQLRRMIDSLSVSPPGATIGVIADPERDQELIVSLPYHLAFDGRPDLRSQVVPINAISADMSCSDFAALILFEPYDAALDALPCLRYGNYRMETYSESVSFAPFGQSFLVSLFAPTPAGYVLIRT
jgi:hypothetical protein